MMEAAEPTRNSFIKVAIVVVPALLIVSICIALYLGANEEQEPSRPIEGEVTVPELADYLNKLNRTIGDRGFGSDEGIQGLRQTAAMIQGSLGPENLGYRVYSNQADSERGLLWETIWINVGESEVESPVIVAVPYGESGTPVAFALGFAEFLTTHEAAVPVRMVFYPPIPSDEELREWIEKRSGAGQVSRNFLVVRGGGADGFWTSASAPSSQVEILGKLFSKKGWEGNVLLSEEPAPHVFMNLSEQEAGSTDAHAQRLIRAMPLVRSLIDELVP